MVISNLKKPGPNVHLTGAGSLPKEISRLVGYGKYKSLRDNKKELTKVLSQPTTLRAIRRGGLSRVQGLGVWQKFRQASKANKVPVSYGDRSEVKEVIAHFRRVAAVKEKKPVAAETSVKASDGSFLTEEQVRRNLARNPQLDELGIRNRRFRPSSGGGQAETTPPGASANEPALRSRRTVGTMERLGIEKKSTGFAQKSYENKPADKPAPPASPGGTRPIGL